MRRRNSMFCSELRSSAANVSLAEDEQGRQHGRGEQVQADADLREETECDQCTGHGAEIDRASADHLADQGIADRLQHEMLGHERIDERLLTRVWSTVDAPGGLIDQAEPRCCYGKVIPGANALTTRRDAWPGLQMCRGGGIDGRSPHRPERSGSQRSGDPPQGVAAYAWRSTARP
jgi:hypothetical protein